MKRIQTQPKTTRKPASPVLDLRTPSGRSLPF